MRRLVFRERTCCRSDSCVRRRTPFHSGHAKRVVIRYRWHPAFGTSVRLVYCEVRRGEAVALGEISDAPCVVVSLRMFDSAVCARMKEGSLASVAALKDMQDLLTPRPRG